MKTHVNFVVKIKTGYYLQLLTPETMKLLGSTDNKITKDKNETKLKQNVPHFENTEVVSIHCNIVSNGYQQDSRVIYTFVPNKPFGNFLHVPKNFIAFKTYKSEFQTMEIWFTDKK